jgi:branched-subunit amino acid transport protein
MSLSLSLSAWEIWGLILALGLGTFLIRFSFLGLIGSKELPDWVLRHLRYTPVAVLPGLVAPLVIWSGTGPEQATDPWRLAAALVTLAVGVWTRSTNWAVLAGAATLIATLVF